MPVALVGAYDELSLDCQFREVKRSRTPIVHGPSQDSSTLAATSLHTSRASLSRPAQYYPWILCPSSVKRGR